MSEDKVEMVMFRSCEGRGTTTSVASNTPGVNPPEPVKPQTCTNCGGIGEVPADRYA